MKRRYPPTYALAALCLLACASDATAERRDLSQLSANPTTVATALHAPVFVDLGITNRSAQGSMTDLGLNRKSNLALTITDPSGQTVQRRLPREGFGRNGDIALEPGASFTERLLLDEWFDFSVEGRYRVKIALAEEDDGSAEPASRPATEITVDVGPRDPAALAALAATVRELADVATSGAGVAQRMQAASDLSFIRDPLAVPALVRVLRRGTLVGYFAVDGLARIGTPEAIAALEQARDDADEDVRARARAALGRLGVAP